MISSPRCIGAYILLISRATPLSNGIVGYEILTSFKPFCGVPCSMYQVASPVEGMKGARTKRKGVQLKLHWYEVGSPTDNTR